VNGGRKLLFLKPNFSWGRKLLETKGSRKFAIICAFWLAFGLGRGKIGLLDGAKKRKTKEKTKMISLENVTAAYSGQAGKCCCGCSGKHYHREDMKDYRGGGTRNDQTQIKRIFKSVMMWPGKMVRTEDNASVEVNGRIFVIYFGQEN
jgi:hypothetical protein